MSGLHAQLKEKPKQVIAELDDLFTEHGIPLIGDNQHVVLQIADHHNSAPTLPTSLPTTSGKALKGKPQLRFEGGEHTAIGDSTLLRFVKDAPAIPAAQVELHLPNGLALTYGQVVALGGDFYGIPDQPISEGATAADRIQRFTNAFNSLAVLPASNAEAKLILGVMQKEIAAIKQAIKDGK
ncbi:MAG: phospholipase, partial [Pseudomonas sp.]